jgi:signal transduction histidine kinase
MVLTSRALARRDRWANALLGAALLLPLILVVIILIHARRSEHAQRQVADRALAHYAAVAAWQLAARIGTEFHTRVEMMVRPVVAGTMADHHAAAAGDTTDCDCMDGAVARVAFIYAPDVKQLGFLSGQPDTATRAVLMRAAQAAAASPGIEPHRVVFAHSGDGTRAISLFVRDTPTRLVYGVESDAEAYRRIIEKILATQSILPPQFVAPPYTGASLAVRVNDTTGLVVFANDGPFPAANAATDSVPRLTHLRVSVAIAPSVADALIIGGLPRPLTGPLLALVALATLLAGAAYLQHRRARELTRMRTEFIASVSHELRTPLTQISMFGETLMLGRERSEGERRQFASIIHREASRLASLVENVMRFTRTSSNRFALRPEVRRLADEVDQALAAFRPIADAAPASITSALDRTVHASVDPGAFRQIVLNLLDNAVKYGPAGQRIDLSLVRDGSHAVLAISDEGPGIPLADRERVFDPFVRLEPRPRRVAGTGIGLAVVRELVTALGGSVSAHDAATGGAAFTVRIPIVEPGAAAP